MEAHTPRGKHGPGWQCHARDELLAAIWRFFQLDGRGAGRCDEVGQDGCGRRLTKNGDIRFRRRIADERSCWDGILRLQHPVEEWVPQVPACDGSALTHRKRAIEIWTVAPDDVKVRRDDAAALPVDRKSIPQL